MANVVIAPVVVAPDTTGRNGYFYQGSVLPEGLAPDRVKALAEAGLVKDLDATELSAADLDTGLAGDRFRTGGGVESRSELLGAPAPAPAPAPAAKPAGKPAPKGA